MHGHTNTTGKESHNILDPKICKMAVSSIKVHALLIFVQKLLMWRGGGANDVN